jgi:p-methyltransferase
MESRKATNQNRLLDCVVIGYNEPPFDQYERLLRQYGTESEAYRDLQYSFVRLNGKNLTYVDLMNDAYAAAAARTAGRGRPDLGLRSGDIPSLAAVYLTTFLRRRGYAADYVNLFQQEKERFAEMLAEDPLCVAITTTLYVVNFPVIEMVEFIRKHNEKVKIVVGGPLISNHVRNHVEDGPLRAALEDLGADFFVAEGQGETTLAALLQCLHCGGDLRLVPNLLFFAGGSLVRTERRPENNSMDENLIEWSTLSAAPLGSTLQTRTARSCAFKCSFCNYPTRAGQLSLTSLQGIERELDSMAARGEVQNVIFIDDTFNVPLPRFKEICRLMIRKRYGFNWFSYFRCSNSDEEAVALMAESGCGGVFLGIESGSPEILGNMSKAATVDKYYRGVELLRRCGILTFGSFIVGFPGETAATVRATVDFMKEAGLDYYRTHMWYNEPGTPIQHRREEFGIEGDGFVWRHATMESLEAMDYIDRIFLEDKAAVWLPQWSYDFWIIPYLFGRGLRGNQLREFLRQAEKLLALEIAAVRPEEKQRLQASLEAGMVELAGEWQLT